MSLDVANHLLDFIPGLTGEGSARLQEALELDLDPDDRATLELARPIAANHFEAVSAGRARDLLEALALELGVTVHAGRGAALAEDLGAALDDIFDDFAARLSALPYPMRSKANQWIASRSHGVVNVRSLPGGDLVHLAERLERAEHSITSGPTVTDAPGSEGPAVGSGDTTTGPSPSSGEAS